jgi:hypothetical protein
MRTKLVVAAVATAAAVSAVGASAFTDSIGSTPTNKVVGYASTAIDGATMAADPFFHYSSGGDTITGIDVVLTNDTHLSTLYINQNGTGAAACVDTPHSDIGVFDSTAHTTTYNCTLAVPYVVKNTTSIGYALR